jgi:beta-glucosidase
METAIDGFQGSPGHLSDPDRVLATAKHFAGDGLTTYGTGSNMQTTGNYPIDQGVDQVDHATFDRLALSPYVTAVREHHVGSVCRLTPTSTGPRMGSATGSTCTATEP